MRRWNHLTHDHDQKLIVMGTNRYNSLSEERKKQVKAMVVTTPDVCFGKTRLDGTRIWIELVVYKYFNNEIEDYEDFKADDTLDAMLVWFFETWMTSEYYTLPDYSGPL